MVNKVNQVFLAKRDAKEMKVPEVHPALRAVKAEKVQWVSKDPQDSKEIVVQEETMAKQVRHTDHFDTLLIPN